AAAPKLRDALLAGDLDVAIYATPMAPLDERFHHMPLYRERFVIVMPPGHRLTKLHAVRVRDLDGECYLARANCDYDELGTRIFEKQRANCETGYESERDDWTVAMAAAGLGIGFMPELSVSHPGVVARPRIDPESWREVPLVTIRGRQYSPAVESLVRAAQRMRWTAESMPAVKTIRPARGVRARRRAA